MRRGGLWGQVLLAAMLALQTACALGIKKDAFVEEFDTLWCDEARTCLLTADPCGYVSPSSLRSCDEYDKKAAKECLEGEFVCIDGVFVPPSSCDKACGDEEVISEEDFGGEFGLHYCLEAQACDEDFECPTVSDVDSSENTCDFDPWVALSCLQTKWTCDSDFGFVTPAGSCAGVCG